MSPRLCAALLFSAVLHSAFAGQAPAEPAPAASRGPVVTEIVVTGSRPAVENRVDRKVYAVSGDLQADLGSAADVLRNIPSVSVDLDGNPSLRGDSDVQVLIDGRYRPEFNGANRGDALQALEAQGIDRIEVMTNPSAGFKREGSAGIINIITRRPLAPRTASAQAGLGSHGRYNANGSVGAQLGKLALRGSAGARHDLRIRDITDRRTVRDDAGNDLNEREQRTDVENDRVSKKLSLGADYDLNEKDRLTAEGSYFLLGTDTVIREDMELRDAAGVPVTRYGRELRSSEYEYSSDALLRFRHSGENDDDGLTIALERSEDRDRVPRRSAYSFSLPPQAVTLLEQLFVEDEIATELSIDFATTWSGKRRFNAGYDLQRTDSDSDSSQSLPVAVGGIETPDPAFTNVFRHEQWIHALYATYEQPLGDWTFLAGLRLEEAQLNLRQARSDERSSQDYFRLYPSLHLARQLDERQNLTFSYARRVRRPFWQDMNPYLQEVETQQFRAGNPDLRPGEIDSVDLGWSYDAGATSLGATIYGRRQYDRVTYVTTLLSPTTVLDRPENLGDNRSGGFELTANGKLGPAFGYNLSANVFYDEIDAANLGFAGTRSTITRDAKAALNWRLGGADRLQINLASQGKRLTPQGYRLGSNTVDLGYRHLFGSGLALSATLSDVFDSRRDRIVLDTAALSERTTVRPHGRIAWIGLSWTMAGGKEKPADNFEYEN